MTEELQELKEHAEDGHENPEMAPVSLTMAILAVLVAVATLLGHRAHTEEVVMQAKASDQWSYYQAKNIRQHQDDLIAELAAAVSSKDADAMAKLHDKSAQESERYKKEKDEIQNQARDLEREVGVERRRANRYDLSEVFLEIGLVITSITLLSRRKRYWHLGLFFSAIGIVLAISAAVHR